MNTALINPLLQPRWGHLSDELDQVFEGFFRPVARTSQRNIVPPLDVSETETAYEVVVDLPGVMKDNIEVTVHEGILTVGAEKASDSPGDDGHAIRRERRYGKFARSLNLGTEVDEASVKAEYRDGVLRITVPKLAKAQPRKVAIDIA